MSPAAVLLDLDAELGPLCERLGFAPHLEWEADAVIGSPSDLPGSL